MKTMPRTGALPLTNADHRLAPLKDLQPGELLLHELYRSLQGESIYAGLPCVFVRTTACNLRCRHCITDAPARTQGGRARTLAPWLLDGLDEAFAHVAAWQYNGENTSPTRLVEPLTFENVQLSQRSYK